MLSLKPNFCFRHCSSLLKPSSFLLIPSSSSSLRFFSSKSQNIRISPANPKNPSMSAPPRNASDVLMAAARAAAKKKTAVSSPKKRKSTQEKDPKPKESVNKDDDLQLNPEEKPNLDSNQAAAQKKTGVSSPKKRKPTQEKDPKPKESVKKDDDLQLNLEEKPALESIQAAGEKKPEASSPKKQKTTKEKEVVPPKEKSPKPEPPSPKAAKKEGKTVNIDANIAQLKKKPSDFKPKSAAYWKDGEPVPFLFLARAFDLISNESGRNASTDILCNAFRTVMATTPKDLIATVYLAANKIAPSHEGIELGIGDSYIIRVLAEAYGRKEDQIKIQLEKLGDLGLVAKASRSSQRVMFPPPPLTVVKVLDTFRAIAKESGKDSQDKKRNHIKGLLVAATDCEPQYLIRLLQSKLRTGFAEKTLLVALGHAAVYSEKKSAPPSQFQSSLEEAAKTVKQVFSVLPNYDKIITALLDGGVSKLSETCSFTPGVPVGPMLAKPTKGVSEILDKFQDTEFTCEYKYDGERAQIHYMDDGSVEIYSRNAERNTAKYPDVIDAAQRFKKASTRSFVLDCEVVAYDREKQKILPFQVLSTRARKAVSMNEITVKICIYAFDILYLNGKSLLQEQLKVRRELLYNSFEEVPGEFQFATATTSTDLEEIQKFLDAAVNSGCEGLIVKTLDGDATYEPSKRSNNWLKLKKDYMDSVGDSLDLVPIAAFHGRGKRTGVYGAFLLACYDDKNEEYQSICKIGTGFTEAMLEARSASLRVKIIEKPKSYYRYAETINPDVWFEPTEVWEVKAADLSISPVHRAATGVVDPNKGISLRFPRLLRVREDKNPEQATSSDQVAEMYRSQKIHHSNNKDDGDD